MAESVSEQPATGHATAGARRAADDDPLVWVQGPCALPQIVKRDVETPGGVSGRELIGRSDIDDHRAGFEKSWNLALCDDLGEHALDKDRRYQGHETVLNDIRP